MQQAESFASRMRLQPSMRTGGGAQDHKESVHTPGGGAAVPARPTSKGRTPSVHDRIQKGPVKVQVLDTRGKADDGDARNVLNKKKLDAAMIHSYSTCRGSHYDSWEDRSPTSEPPGTRVFSREIHAASIPLRFRQPATVNKYSGETDPRVWLNDYRLACQLGGATDDAMIIRNLPLHLADSARTWLEHLPANQIHSWSDLVDTFVGNFQGTYVRPGTSWDM